MDVSATLSGKVRGIFVYYCNARRGPCIDQVFLLGQTLDGMTHRSGSLALCNTTRKRRNMIDCAHCSSITPPFSLARRYRYRLLFMILEGVANDVHELHLMVLGSTSLF
jgi:hypothetical protein